ncbi:MAG: hypothetical protein K6E63_00880 [Lachnospiraceae bacterium]|nr:hypothetical protein [Lachnospiraceae bacterium]
MALILLLSGCSSSSDRYSINEINEYTRDNEEELVYISKIASNILTEDYYRISKDEDENIIVFSSKKQEHAKTTSDFYLDAEGGDKGTGSLSSSLIPQPNSWVTTIEDVNASGILIAINDYGSHVSVRPTNASISVWAQQGVKSEWTQTLIAISTKFK